MRGCFARKKLAPPTGLARLIKVGRAARRPLPGALPVQRELGAPGQRCAGRGVADAGRDRAVVFLVAEVAAVEPQFAALEREARVRLDQRVGALLEHRGLLLVVEGVAGPGEAHAGEEAGGRAVVDEQRAIARGL